MAFRNKIILILTLVILVVVVQMIALNILTSQPLAQLPSEEDQGMVHVKDKRDGHTTHETIKSALKHVSRKLVWIKYNTGRLALALLRLIYLIPLHLL